jgi:hypothetical protein
MVNPFKFSGEVCRPSVPPRAGAQYAADISALETPEQELERFAEEKKATETNGPGNPAAWVANEALWEKAKRAAQHAGASDKYAFTVWWYLQHGGTKK